MLKKAWQKGGVPPPLNRQNPLSSFWKGPLDPNTLRQIFLEIAWQNWPFKIGLNLLDFKQLLVDSESIVQWLNAVYPGSLSDRNVGVFLAVNFVAQSSI